MGDRGNVLIGDKFSRVFLYTHWGGEALPYIVQRALQRGERWTDAPYLARIVFSHMIADQNMDPEVVKRELFQTTGLGIATYMSDNEHDIIYLDTEKQQVSYISEKTARDWDENKVAPKRVWSMKDYANADTATITEAFH